MIRALLAAILLCAFCARAADYTDLWWNAEESGWGVTLAHQNDKVFGVWYVYDASGEPFWVTMPDGTFAAGGRSVSGTLYRTTGPGLRETFDPARVTTTAVGSARLDFDADATSATASYVIDGRSVTKRLSRQPFGSAPANHPEDLSDLWWDPKESGWGFSLTQHGDRVFGVWYAYGDDGKPLWLALPDGRISGSGSVSGKLYTTSGGAAWSSPFVPANVQVAEAGSAKISFEGEEGKLTATVAGRSHTKRLVRQRFGAAPGATAKPSVTLEALAAGADGVAPGRAALRANATDSDGRIVLVEFFRGSEKVGAAVAAPFEAAVPGLEAGKHAFSAVATDDRGARRMAGATLEIKANRAPTVTLSRPYAGAAYIVGSTLELSVSAKDSDGAIARVEYYAGPTRVAQSAASPWSASWTPSAEGDLQLVAVATDDKGASTASTPVGINVSAAARTLEPALRDAARFLTQATFGIRDLAEIDALRARGPSSWIDEQMAMAAASHVDYVEARKAAGEKPREEHAYEAIWQQWLAEPAQLRARMAFALSEIFVISNIAPDLDTYAMASYMDMLNRNAFGNYRQLLEEVTLHPAMGYYLNMIGSKKANPAKGTHPNENYAREVMQLFSIGLYKLNQDGSRMLDAQGRPIPTYDQSVVQAMAAAFTGWSFAGNDTTRASVFDPAKENWREPLVAWEMHHDTQPKALFDGIVLPANQGARQDMAAALEAIYRHPNVGPFIGRQLIQRFVTSNPSPAYIGRVAAAFADNGRGVRGDLGAVIRAVLLDPEARDLARAAGPHWGKQREPVIRFANFLRAFKAASPSGRNRIWYLDNADEGLNQSPLLSPSVFNFFSPNYRQPGALSAANLVAPEFQVTTETSMVGGLNFFARLVRNGYYGSGETRLTLELAALNELAARPAELADRLDLLLLAGAMSPRLRASLVSTLNALPLPKTEGSAVNDRVKAALILVAMSPDFAIQK
jgi:uncharacterized protein (DUF1800 family)